jgi:hypothetical protein
MRFLQDPQDKRVCSIEPFTMMALGGGAMAGGSIGKGAAGFFGGKSKADAERKAAQQYIDYTQGQRKEFLDTNRPIYDRLKMYAAGNYGMDADAFRQMKDQINEDYGAGLSDISRISANSAIGKNTGGGNVYTPGRYDRTTRLLGQNLAANRAKMMRDLNVKNEELAESNRRWAVSALPTYSPGLPATPMMSPDTFRSLNAVAPVGDYIGEIFGSVGQMGAPFLNAGAQGAIFQRLMAARRGSGVSDGGVDWSSPHSAMLEYNPGYDYGIG